MWRLLGQVILAYEVRSIVRVFQFLDFGLQLVDVFDVSGSEDFENLGMTYEFALESFISTFDKIQGSAGGKQKLLPVCYSKSSSWLVSLYNHHRRILPPKRMEMTMMTATMNAP